LASPGGGPLADVFLADGVRQEFSRDPFRKARVEISFDQKDPGRLDCLDGGNAQFANIFQHAVALYIRYAGPAENFNTPLSH
jgi:hypothetical protein